jgi:hypothetical protein
MGKPESKSLIITLKRSYPLQLLFSCHAVWVLDVSGNMEAHNASIIKSV